ncbi:MAG: hypothetical protein ABIG63_09905 [Chloroflexota bacterium]
MPNGNGQNSGDRFGRIPTTQIIEKREETVQSAVRNPVAQARHLALGWATLVLSFILAMLSFGPAVFWLATFVVSAATFLWFLLQAARTEYVNEKGSHIGITPSEALAGFLVSALAGFIAWSLWRVLALVAVDIVLPAWLASWLPNLTALASLIGTIFSTAYIIHLEPAFLQELLYRSPAIEQGIGNLVSQEKAPWYAGRVQRPPTSLPKPIPQWGLPTAARVAPTDKGRENTQVPNGNDNSIEAAASASSISKGIFEAPSGGIRYRQDLAEFVQAVGSGIKAPQLGAWESKGQGRDYGWWTDMVDTAALFGLVSAREGGAKTQVLRQDWQTILREIEQRLD